MSVSDIDLAERLRAERLAAETLYRAFNDRNPNRVDGALTSDWEDIPLAPGQAPGPAGIKPIIQGVVRAFPDVRIILDDVIQVRGQIAVRRDHRHPPRRDLSFPSADLNNGRSR